MGVLSEDLARGGGGVRQHRMPGVRGHLELVLPAWLFLQGGARGDSGEAMNL